MTAWLISILQTFLFIAFAPLLAGWLRWWKCYLQNRKAPPLWQPYLNLRKLFLKEPILPESASWIFRAAPYVVFVSAFLVASVVPMIAVNLPTAAVADVIVIVGFFALGRFFLVLAGMDVGTAFGGMGSSREATIAALAEPAFLMVVFTLAMTASTTNLSVAVENLLSQGLILRPSYVFALLALILVAMAETGRIPVDNPATHLELTMIHEAMILEYSGRYLAMIEWASQLRLMVYGVLIANIFLPWGIARSFDMEALGAGIAAVLGKLALLAVALALVETTLAKMRLFRVQEFLGFAFFLGVLGMLSHIILEVG